MIKWLFIFLIFSAACANKHPTRPGPISPIKDPEDEYRQKLQRGTEPVGLEPQMMGQPLDGTTPIVVPSDEKE